MVQSIIVYISYFVTHNLPDLECNLLIVIFFNSIRDDVAYFQICIRGSRQLTVIQNKCFTPGSACHGQNLNSIHPPSEPLFTMKAVLMCKEILDKVYHVFI